MISFTGDKEKFLNSIKSISISLMDKSIPLSLFRGGNDAYVAGDIN